MLEKFLQGKRNYQWKEKPGALQLLLLIVIRLYQLSLAYFIGNQCRFVPSCSEYSFEAICKYGAIKGSYMGLRRIMRCRPFKEGGIDLVP